MTFPNPTRTGPSVSVVMANYNGAAHLGAAIASVQNQTLSGLELLVIDDGSTDNSAEIVLQHGSEDPRIQLLQTHRNAGPAAARNLGFAAARGSWIAVLDADDLFHPRRLEGLVAAAVTGGHPVIADDLIYFTEGTRARPGRLFEAAELGSACTLGVADLLKPTLGGAPNHVGYVKPLIRRDALGSLRYNAQLRVGEDFDLLLRLALRGHPLTLLPEALYLYRRHHGSTSHRLKSRDALAMVNAMSALGPDIADQAPEASDLLEERVRAMARAAREAEIADHLRTGSFVSAARSACRAPIAAARTANSLVNGRFRRMLAPAAPSMARRDLVLLGKGSDAACIPAGWHTVREETVTRLSPALRAELVATAADPTTTLYALGTVGADLTGFLPDPDRVVHLPSPAANPPRVHVRTTTYKRPRDLSRALESLRAQTVEDWVCDVFDDDPDRAGEAVVARLSDPRIRYHANSPQRFASANIDRAFTRFNPHDAQYFCCLEDDNQLLPRFLEDNIRVCEREGVNIVLRNQYVERNSGTAEACIGADALLDEKFTEGLIKPEALHLSVMADWGVSNGGLFWSRDAVSDLEIGVPCSAAFQEYLRTVSIVEPMYVAMTPLAVWAENGEATSRDLGAKAGWLRRELALKRSVQALRVHVWSKSSPLARQSYVEGTLLGYPAEMRQTELAKSLCTLRTGQALARRDVVRLLMRGLAIWLVGTPMTGLNGFLRRRRSSRPGLPAHEAT